MSLDNTNASGRANGAGRRTGRSAGLVIAWLFIAAGFAAGFFVLPQTLQGYEGFGVEKGLITLWICIYGFIAGIGTVTLLGILGGARVLPKIVLAVYVVFLATLIITAMLGAK